MKKKTKNKAKKLTAKHAHCIFWVVSNDEEKSKVFKILGITEKTLPPTYNYPHMIGRSGKIFFDQQAIDKPDGIHWNDGKTVYMYQKQSIPK